MVSHPTRITQPLQQCEETDRSKGIILVISICVSLGFLMWWASAHFERGHAENPPKPILVKIPASMVPFVRQDAWSRESRGIGDHRKETISYFDVEPTPVSPINDLPQWSEWIYTPDDWSNWGKEFRGEDVSQCQAWFTFFNSGRWYGPFDQNHLPEFTNPPAISWSYPKTKWRVATNCTLRYFQRG